MASKGPREPFELRPLRMQLRKLDHHDGSALFGFGPVSALAAVSGPSEVRIRDERTDRAALQIHFTPLQGMAGTSAVAFEQALNGIWTYALQLHLYPRALIQIHLQTYCSPSMLVPRPFVESSSASTPIPNAPPVQTPHPDAPISCSLKAAHINATTLACLDAAMNMRCLVGAASAAVVRKGLRANQMRGWRAGERAAGEEEGRGEEEQMELEGKDQRDIEIVLDPSPYEESLARSVHTFAFAFELSSIEDKAGGNTRQIIQDRLRSRLVYNESQGKQESAEYIDCLALCRQASQDIVVQMRETVRPL